MNTYWSGKGQEQEKYNELVKAGFEFTQKTNNVFRSYYKYYNDGDLPMWAKQCRKYTQQVAVSYYYRRELNEIGSQMLEDRVTAAIVSEYKRFSKLAK